MNTKNIIIAATLGVFGAIIAALALSFRSPMDADTLVGYGCVLALIGVTAIEYRINWKRVFGRE